MTKYLLVWAAILAGSLMYSMAKGRPDIFVDAFYWQGSLVLIFAWVYWGSAKFTFQRRVRTWCTMCFGKKITENKPERSHRYLEESLELVQSVGMTKEEVLMLVNYTYNRPVGETKQEVGGVMITLAALCNAHKIDMMHEGEVEYIRINRRDVVARIRNKQMTKPKSGPLPE